MPLGICKYWVEILPNLHHYLRAWYGFCLFRAPGNQRIPLEEMAKLFGDEVVVYAEDLHVDHNTHELIVDEHGVVGGSHVHRIATEAGVSDRLAAKGHDVEKSAVGHESSVEHVDTVQNEKY